MDIELQQVRYFLAVVETGSFTRAAKRSGVAQPSLSAGMAALERALRSRLFDRLSRGVRLTEAGRALLPRAREAVAAMEGLRGAVAERSGEVAGSLVVGASPTLAPYVGAPAVAAFVKAHRRAEATLREGASELVLEWVKGGEVDIGLVGVAVEDGELLAEGLFSETLVVACPKRRRGGLGAARGEVTLGEVLEEGLIVPDELGGFLPGRWRSRGAVRGRGLGPAAALALVAHGAGPCLLPASARGAGGGKVVFRGLKPVVARPVVAVTHRDRVRSGAVRAFLQTLGEVLPGVL